MLAAPLRHVVVIPAYNEADSIGPIVEAVKAQGYPVFVINDGSVDATAQIAREKGATVFTNLRNLGLGRTIRRGYKEALRSGAEIIVQIDADGQYRPEDIRKIVEPIEQGQADLVLGSRLENLHYRMPWMKKFGNRAFSRVLRSVTGQDVKDGQTGFRAMRREVLERCLPINEFSYTQEMIIRASREGFLIKSVPIDFLKRYSGESRLIRTPIHYAFLGWWIIVRTWRDYSPIKFFLIPGLVFLGIALAAAGFVLYHVVTTGQIQGRVGTLIVAGVSFLFAVQLVFLGLLADMIRTHTKF